MLSDRHLIDLATIVVGYALAVGFVLRWVHRAEQDAVPKTSATIGMVFIRSAMVAAVVWGVAMGLGIPAWWIAIFLIGSNVLALGSTGFGDFVAMPGTMASYFAFQFVTGFPIQRELILAPPPPVDNCRDAELNALIGQSGTITSPLKPFGTVSVNGQELPAVADDDAFVDAGQSVAIIGTKSGSVVVRV